VILELQRYDWPGNVRELQTVLERMMIMSGDRIGSLDLPEEILAALDRPAAPQASSALKSFATDPSANSSGNAEEQQRQHQPVRSGSRRGQNLPPQTPERAQNHQERFLRVKAWSIPHSSSCDSLSAAGSGPSRLRYHGRRPALSAAEDNLTGESMRSVLRCAVTVVSCLLAVVAPARAYDNFKVAVYCRAHEVREMADPAWLESRWKEHGPKRVALHLPGTPPLARLHSRKDLSTRESPGARRIDERFRTA
jgi:hypothetical protein